MSELPDTFTALWIRQDGRLVGVTSDGRWIVAPLVAPDGNLVTDDFPADVEST